jgi:hypothetical protein
MLCYCVTNKQKLPITPATKEMYWLSGVKTVHYAVWCILMKYDNMHILNYFLLMEIC